MSNKEDIIVNIHKALIDFLSENGYESSVECDYVQFIDKIVKGGEKKKKALLKQKASVLPDTSSLFTNDNNGEYIKVFKELSQQNKNKFWRHLQVIYIVAETGNSTSSKKYLSKLMSQVSFDDDLMKLMTDTSEQKDKVDMPSVAERLVDEIITAIKLTQVEEGVPDFKKLMSVVAGFSEKYSKDIKSGKLNPKNVFRALARRIKELTGNSDGNGGETENALQMFGKLEEVLSAMNGNSNPESILGQLNKAFQGTDGGDETGKIFNDIMNVLGDVKEGDDIQVVVNKLLDMLIERGQIKPLTDDQRLEMETFYENYAKKSEEQKELSKLIGEQKEIIDSMEKNGKLTEQEQIKLRDIRERINKIDTTALAKVEQEKKQKEYNQELTNTLNNMTEEQKAEFVKRAIANMSR